MNINKNRNKCYFHYYYQTKQVGGGTKYIHVNRNTYITICYIYLFKYTNIHTSIFIDFLKIDP